MKSRLLTSVQQGRPVVGISHVIQDESVTETLRDVALDFLFIDFQHIAITIETLQRTLIALQPTELSVLVRPPSNDTVAIGQILDAGADGVIVPMVNTADDAIRAVAAVRYPPEGNRSWGPRRAQRIHGGPEQYARHANDNVVVIIQVETEEAVKNLDDILAVPGLSGVMVGPADLAISMGHLHDRTNPRVRDTMQSVMDRCRQRGVPFGYFAASAEDGAYWIERGGLIVTCSSDTAFVAQGVTQISDQLAAARAR
ncbi:HpcH/HpaI aldolase family protein [Pseudonocardia kunmingensis]|uniref:2-dehydro-3-deoxyglucarate aldolase/4-hydroxy-2-oxoheptanedioate aldolase n=1 Tax=Pseudonocardia kunmingensis TaxID=630975 RepID=A0A543CX01_9PSEU|nr:aldolase/citrate lyase family protein [Pseudonocardia kunmingensis]TQM01643.1 2-dehydro-3-deoxyglucarate aldolase/4-hydroxy-2-oxoheptanedioate aldolase [Pseudonocardia kunmingensis]